MLDGLKNASVLAGKLPEDIRTAPDGISANYATDSLSQRCPAIVEMHAILHTGRLTVTNRVSIQVQQPVQKLVTIFASISGRVNLSIHHRRRCYREVDKQQGFIKS